MFAGWVEQQTDLKMPGDLTTGALERYQMHLMRKRCTEGACISAGPTQ